MHGPNTSLCARRLKGRYKENLGAYANRGKSAKARDHDLRFVFVLFPWALRSRFNLASLYLNPLSTSRKLAQ